MVNASKNSLIILFVLYILFGLSACSPGTNPTLSPSANNALSSPATTVSTATLPTPSVMPSNTVPIVPTDVNISTMISAAEFGLPNNFVDIPASEIKSDLAPLYESGYGIDEIRGRKDNSGNEYILCRSAGSSNMETLSSKVDQSASDFAIKNNKEYDVVMNYRYGIICFSTDKDTLQAIVKRVENSWMGILP